VVAPKKPYNCTKGKLEDIDITDYDKVERIPRTRIKEMNPVERKQSFAEIAPGFTGEMAKAEAERCLACGCQDAFSCRLRELATEYEVDDTRYAGRKRHMAINEDEHPNIIRDPNKCILCGRCVRICSEVQGVSALGLIHRGFETIVGPPLDMLLCETSCESCGQCLSTCPTGALMPKVELPKPGPWKLEPVASVCPHCGIGCNLELNVAGNRIVNVTSPVGNTVNNGNLCKKGVFDPCSLNHLNRLHAPMIKLNGELIETDWEEALTVAAKGLQQIRDKFGGDKLAVLSSSI
jgi:formate dehydrogenase major subunit